MALTLPHAIVVRIVFALAFLVLLVPSSLMAVAHGAVIARVAGATLSTLLVWWCLYRLCMRAERQAWFVAASIPVLAMGVFTAPAYAWGALAIMYVAQRFVRWYPRAESAAVSRTRDAAEDVPPATDAGAADTSTHETRSHIVDLDPICAPYRRMLLSLRAIRAAIASLAGSALLTGPGLLLFAMYDFDAPGFGVISGVAVTAFLLAVGALFVVWQRALWIGSLKAARFGAAITALLAVGLVLWVVTTVRSDMFETGTIWYLVVAFALQLTIVFALGAASVILVRQQRDATLIAMLRQNSRHTWPAAMLHLCGIVTPRRRALDALVHRSVLLSALAFCLEGTAFYVYFRAGTNFLRAGDRVVASGVMLSPFPGRLSLLEAHYVNLLIIAAVLLPILYVTTQVTLTLADRLRNAARRAAVRSAEDLLNEDERPPILFLRDFDDDQVSLGQGSLPAWSRVVDPGVELANLEDVMQTYAALGPLVAIGRPEDVRPPIGVARRYVRSGDWQSVVLSLMDGARIVVVGTSDSPGLVWEIEHLRDRGHLEKSVFVLPPTAAGNAALLWRIAQLISRHDGQDVGGIGTVALPSIGTRRAVGMVLRDGAVTVFVTKRRPSQVELDVLLRLTDPTCLPPSRVQHSFFCGASDGCTLM
ncbi:MAG TPA: hypothetical protein VM818_16400 [Vicinamibacterales bacterium]|nr:hypothetical protein [Vicinamibacterales bacterium]